MSPEVQMQCSAHAVRDLLPKYVSSYDHKRKFAAEHLMRHPAKRILVSTEQWERVACSGTHHENAKAHGHNDAHKRERPAQRILYQPSSPTHIAFDVGKKCVGCMVASWNACKLAASNRKQALYYTVTCHKSSPDARCGHGLDDVGLRVNSAVATVAVVLDRLGHRVCNSIYDRHRLPSLLTIREDSARLLDG